MAAPDLERLLAELLEPDSDVIRRATARLREAFADPQTPARLGLLLSAAPRPQVRPSADWEGSGLDWEALGEPYGELGGLWAGLGGTGRTVRQLAAVLLRRRLLGGWKRLDPALRQRLPSLLAQALEQETEVGFEVPHTLFCPPPPPPPPQAALLVLSAALDTAPQALAPHGPPLAALCRGALAPGVPPGPMAYGLRALGGLAATLGDTQTELLRSLLPDILTALKTLLDADEDRGAEALEVLDEFVEADPAAVTPHLRPLLDFCLQVGGDESRGDAVRVRALATVTFLAQKRPKALLRGGLLAPVLGGLLTPLCADPPPRAPRPRGGGGGGGGGRRRPGGAQPPTRRRPGPGCSGRGAAPRKTPPAAAAAAGGGLGEPPGGRPQGGAAGAGGAGGGVRGAPAAEVPGAGAGGAAGGGWGTPNPPCGGRPPSPCAAWPTACSRR
ncbi:importin-4 [Accipiter gentilis]|uniref:importin-4 n=1 Tax=Astur gentilis TaxID=8957 RepID=UPI00210F4874|nr:importin-4 [Accipiter gentilis]